MRPLVVKATQVAKWEVKIGGEEPPKVMWSFKGEDKPDGERHKTEVKKRESTNFTVSGCRRADCGTYKLTLTNSVGQAEGTIELTVLAAPSAPMGPLDVSSGMVDISNLFINIFEWSNHLDRFNQILDYIIGGDVGNRFTDSRQLNKIVRAFKGNFQSLTHFNDGVRYSSNFQIIQVHDVFEDCCDLGWKPPEDDGGVPIDHYEVEKMDLETGRWQPVGKVKDCKAHVDGLKKGNSYMFRVKAVNKEGVSEPLTTDIATVAKNPFGWFCFIVYAYCS